MTAWVFTISKDYPQHWRYAVEHGLWDTRSFRAVKAGDVVYFWQSRQSFVGRVIATSDLFAHSEPDGPWDNSDTGNYAYRFRLRVDADGLAGDQVKWAQVQEATGIRHGLNIAPFTVRPQAESWLSQLFERRTGEGFWSTYSQPIGLEEGSPLPTPDLVAGGVTVDLDPDTDERERVSVAIALRRGQSRFRNALLDAYGRRCAITGWDVVEVLEAAHISPYRGAHTHRVQNGLLLRSDLHTLFDVHLLTVGADDRRVQLAPALRDGPYGDLAGEPIRTTTSPDFAPSTDLLRRHNRDCHAWFRGVTS